MKAIQIPGTGQQALLAETLAAFASFPPETLPAPMPARKRPPMTIEAALRTGP